VRLAELVNLPKVLLVERRVGAQSRDWAPDHGPHQSMKAISLLYDLVLFLRIFCQPLDRGTDNYFGGSHREWVELWKLGICREYCELLNIDRTEEIFST
jgi:hypothetical protein